MKTIESILSPTDFSEGSLQGLSAAKEIAVRFGAQLCVIHVLPIMPALPATEPALAFQSAEYERLYRKDVEQRLDKIVHNLQHQGIASRAFIGYGDAASEIVRISEQFQMDLIVIATFGKTGWRRLAFGSVTERVVRMALCPVLTVRGVEPEVAAA